MTIYYVTKHCLTDGIFELDLEQSDGRWSDMASGYREIRTSTNVERHRVTYFIDRECFLNKEAAVKNAYERRDKAIKAAEKKINKLKSLNFEV